jgi:hypothetical protein
MRNIFTFLFAVFVMLGCQTIADKSTPTKQNVNYHLNGIIMYYTGIVDFPKYDIIEYSYKEDVVEYSLAFELRFYEKGFERLMKEFNDFIKVNISAEGFEWTISDENTSLKVFEPNNKSIKISIDFKNRRLLYKIHDAKVGNNY